VGPGVVAAGDEGAPPGDGAHGIGDGLRRGDTRRVFAGADDDEVVVHDQPPLDEVAGVHELPLRLGGMDQDRIRVTRRRHLEGRPGADGDHLDLDPALLLEAGHEQVE
jgi:hypothetical protein